jgi:hypothetical protein
MTAPVDYIPFQDAEPAVWDLLRAAVREDGEALWDLMVRLRVPPDTTAGEVIEKLARLIGDSVADQAHDEAAALAYLDRWEQAAAGEDRAAEPEPEPEPEPAGDDARGGPFLVTLGTDAPAFPVATGVYSPVRSWVSRA